MEMKDFRFKQPTIFFKTGQEVHITQEDKYAYIMWVIACTIILNRELNKSMCIHTFRLKQREMY